MALNAGKLQVSEQLPGTGECYLIAPQYPCIHEDTRVGHSFTYFLDCGTDQGRYQPSVRILHHSHRPPSWPPFSLLHKV